MQHIKKQLYNLCQEYIAKRIGTATEAIRASQAAANEEEKSSAGDKYETGRAMMQLEMEKDLAQRAEALKLKQTLDLIKYDLTSPKIRTGSLVITDQGNFFIAISVGKLVVENTSYAVVSAESPIGAKLIGLEKGSTFTFANKTYTVGQVY